MIAFTLFYNPMTIHFYNQIWLVLPVCVAVAIIYKTVRTQNLRRLPLEILASLGYMVGGLVALAVILWLILKYWP